MSATPENDKRQWASDKEHVQYDGARCPACGEGNIEGDFVVTGGGVAQQRMSCMDCEAQWEDQYRLVGYF